MQHRQTAVFAIDKTLLVKVSLGNITGFVNMSAHGMAHAMAAARIFAEAGLWTVDSGRGRCRPPYFSWFSKKV
jgi:hypothetical protein